MELGLSLGTRVDVDITNNHSNNNNNNNNNNNSSSNLNNNMGFCMGLGISRSSNSSSSEKLEEIEKREKVGSTTTPQLELDLRPLSPLPRHSQPSPPLRFPWLSDNVSSEPGSSDGPGSRTPELNQLTVAGVTAEEGEEQSSPNSGTSSFMEFTLYTSTNNSNSVGRGTRGINNNGENRHNNGSNYGQEMMMMMMVGGTPSRAGSDDDENGSTRKKLRLSKEQSAFLEESFKEHHTLNPKQKLALAKQLNLRPRQVEVWFQNRRARTKLKQTEVDCEYLKRCCETLTEENRRLQKELQELRALKTSQPFFMHLPATTLTMCPSCERVAPTSTTTATTTPTPVGPGSVTLSLGNPKSKPVSDAQTQS